MKRTKVLGTFSLICFIFLISYGEYLKWEFDAGLETHYGNITEVDAYEAIRYDLNGKVILIKGNLTISKSIPIIQCGMEVYALKVKRSVEMYQWVPKMHHWDIAQYYYVQEWSNENNGGLIGFDLQKGTIKTYFNKDKTKKDKIQISTADAFIGNYKLSYKVHQYFNDYSEMIATHIRKPFLKDNYRYFCSEESYEKMNGDYLFKYFAAGIQGSLFTIIALQDDGILYPMKHDLLGPIAIVQNGNVSLNKIFDKNNLFLYITFLRFCALLALVQIYLITDYLKKYKEGLFVFLGSIIMSYISGYV